MKAASKIVSKFNIKDQKNYRVKKNFETDNLKNTMTKKTLLLNLKNKSMT